MKRLIKGIIFSTLLIFSGLTASATEVNEVDIEIGAGLTPESPFYFLDKGIESIRLWIAGDEQDAELLLEFAEERLAELNQLNTEGLSKYADKLYEEYGTNLEKVNEYVAKQVIENRKSSSLDRIKEKLDHVSEIDQAVRVIDRVSIELKDKISESQVKAYSISIVSQLDLLNLEELKAQGLNNGEMIQLMALIELSGKSVEELTFLDIYKDESRKKEIDFKKLAIELGMINEDSEANLAAIKEQFRNYRNVLKETNKEIRGLSETEREVLLNEILQRRMDVKQEINSLVHARLQERLSEFNSIINDVYRTKLEIINNLDETIMTSDRKTELIQKLDLMKVELIANITVKVLDSEISPRDLGELTALIHKEFNALLEDELSLSEDEKEEFKNRLNEMSNQVKPMFNQIIIKLQDSKRIPTLSSEQVQIIWDEVQETIESHHGETSDHLLDELEYEIIEQIETLLNETNEEEVNPNIEAIFTELLTKLNLILENRLNDSEMGLFKEKLLLAKDEILIEINPYDHDFKIKLALIDLINDRLETFLSENNLINPDIDTIFHEILDSALFKVSSRLNDETFETFKYFLLENKETILNDIDGYKNDEEIKMSLLDLFQEKLTEFQGLVDLTTLFDEVVASMNNSFLYFNLSPEKQAEMKDKIISSINSSQSINEVKSEIIRLITLELIKYNSNR